MATFGKTTDGASSTGSSTDRKKVSSASPATNGTATQITVRLWLSAAGSTTVKGVIYADSAGAPGALLATSDEVTITSTTEAEVNFPLSGANQISVVGGTTYWIGFHQKDPGVPSLNISRDATANGLQTNTDVYSDGPTDPFGTPTGEAGPIDCYVTYTEATTTSTTTTTSTSSSTTTTSTSTSTSTSTTTTMPYHFSVEGDQTILEVQEEEGKELEFSVEHGDVKS